VKSVVLKAALKAVKKVAEKDVGKAGNLVVYLVVMKVAAMVGR
jgi:hypothetical protein